ncbi:hypothetical protein DVR12_14420 [Chitinophaga silvatica]|uniref:Uncharacterized protein n=1 Tax=Chitinophaga silvatica TaxID=2282649 RepID=A0A3E1Y8W4_9BACT|nr:hypothetical protein DVR12_14420 [Chitinophaga silvatica]
MDILFQLDDYIKCKTGNVSDGILKVFKNMKDHIAAFQDYHQKPVTFDSFDFNLYDSLIKFLTYEYIQRRRSEVIDGKKV